MGHALGRMQPVVVQMLEGALSTWTAAPRTDAGDSHYAPEMLLRRAQLDAIVRGEVTLAFRRWKRATVKPGGTLKTAVGVIAIDSIERVTMSSISAADARAAGFERRADLIDELKRREGSVDRIALHFAGADPRVALRKKSRLSTAERTEIREKLESYDGHSRRGPWTARVLKCIAKNPSTLAAELASELGHEKAWFKTNVRKLKSLGLTESLKVGYRLSPRGKAFFDGS